MSFILWLVAIYLLIGSIIYFISFDIMSEDETFKMSEHNNIIMLSIVVLWLPILIVELFSSRY